MVTVPTYIVNGHQGLFWAKPITSQLRGSHCEYDERIQDNFFNLFSLVVQWVCQLVCLCLVWRRLCHDRLCSFLDDDLVLIKRDVIFDMRSCVFGSGVVPGGLAVSLGKWPIRRKEKDVPSYISHVCISHFDIIVRSLPAPYERYVESWNWTVITLSKDTSCYMHINICYKIIANATHCVLESVKYSFLIVSGAK